MSDMPKISEAEYEIMKAVWKHAPISTNEVVSLFEGGDWSPKQSRHFLQDLLKRAFSDTKKREGCLCIHPSLTKRNT